MQHRYIELFLNSTPGNAGGGGGGLGSGNFGSMGGGGFGGGTGGGGFGGGKKFFSFLSLYFVLYPGCILECCEVLCSSDI
jgi:hypothetical protein